MQLFNSYVFPGTIPRYRRSKRYRDESHPHRYRLGNAMRVRLKLLTVGLVLVTASLAGCSSTTAGPAGAIQNDAMTAASAGPSSSPASSGAAVASADPAASPTATSPAPASPVATPTDAPAASASPPLLGSSSNGYSAVCSGTCHYLEAQPSALSGGYSWCVGPGATTRLSPGTGGAIGTGYSNTQTMATFSGYCSSGAANAALASTVGGYADWFLPSQSELSALATNWDWPNHGASPTYWTSSQAQGGQAWAGSVGGGAGCCHLNTSTSGSPYLYSVWPMRAF